MKNFAIKIIMLTTLFFLGFVVYTHFEVIPWLLLTLFVIGHLLILYMVYSVLKDPYKTKKTFKDWYEDRPMKHSSSEI